LRRRGRGHHISFAYESKRTPRTYAT
jgi:hypothetical protein